MAAVPADAFIRCTLEGHYYKEWPVPNRSALQRMMKFLELQCQCDVGFGMKKRLTIFPN